MPRVLVTGFNRFGERASNSSELIVEELARRQLPRVVFEVLPTAFRAGAEQIESLIRSGRPEVVLMLGMAASSTTLRLERYARNRDASEVADNHGEHRYGPIVVDGPDVYTSTLPLERFAEAVRTLGTPVEFSEDAGGFVCNHVYYRARHCVQGESSRIRCGFLHVPALEPADLGPWVDALEACLGVLGTRPSRGRKTAAAARRGRVS